MPTTSGRENVTLFLLCSLFRALCLRVRVALVSHLASHARQPGVSRLERRRRRSPLSAPRDVPWSSARSLSPNSSAGSPRATGVSAFSLSDPATVAPLPVATVVGLAPAPLAARVVFLRLSLSPAAPKTFFEASITDSTSMRFVGRLAKAWTFTKGPTVGWLAESGDKVVNDPTGKSSQAPSFVEAARNLNLDTISFLSIEKRARKTRHRDPYKKELKAFAPLY